MKRDTRTRFFDPWEVDQLLDTIPVPQLVCSGWYKRQGQPASHAAGCAWSREPSKGRSVRHGISPECDSWYRRVNGLRPGRDEWGDEDGGFA